MIKKIMLTLLMFVFGFGDEKISWQEYKTKYLRGDGFIVDPYNENRVTSESQGYGMLLAVIYDDLENFERLWKWTKKNLMREDKLFAWHYNNNRIVDRNNATDGDLLIAFALRLAYERWKKAQYLKDYREIEKSIRRLFVIIDNQGEKHVLLLPATYGFSNERYELLIFPSYYISPILKAFGKEDSLYRQAFEYLNRRIINRNRISDIIKFNLLEKDLYETEKLTMDAYRLIPYFYLAKQDTEPLTKTFERVDKFFKMHGYIPLEFYPMKNSGTAQESPFCVYRWFYMIYKDQRYLNKYKELKKVDKNNYFCDSFELFLDSGWRY